MRKPSLVHLYVLVLLLSCWSLSGCTGVAPIQSPDIIEAEHSNRTLRAGGGEISGMSVPLALLLPKDRRTPSAIEATRTIAQRLGFQVTATGAASLSCRLAESDFQRLFGRAPRRLAPEPPGAGDAGRPGGYAEEEPPLPVPPELAAYVEAISVIPPARRF
jgi:hypothetical protein